MFIVSKPHEDHTPRFIAVCTLEPLIGAGGWLRLTTDICCSLSSRGIKKDYRTMFTTSFCLLSEEKKKTCVLCTAEKLLFDCTNGVSRVNVDIFSIFYTQALPSGRRPVNRPGDRPVWVGVFVCVFQRMLLHTLGIGCWLHLLESSEVVQCKGVCKTCLLPCLNQISPALQSGKKKNINIATILNRGKQTLQTWYYTAGMRPQCPFPIKAGDAVVVQKRLRCCVSSSDSLGRVWLYEWRLPFRAPCLQAESGA